MDELVVWGEVSTEVCCTRHARYVWDCASCNWARGVSMKPKRIPVTDAEACDSCDRSSRPIICTGACTNWTLKKKPVNQWIDERIMTPFAIDVMFQILGYGKPRSIKPENPQLGDLYRSGTTVNAFMGADRGWVEFWRPADNGTG